MKVFITKSKGKGIPEEQEYIYPANLVITKSGMTIGELAEKVKKQDEEIKKLKQAIVKITDAFAKL